MGQIGAFCDLGESWGLILWGKEECGRSFEQRNALHAQEMNAGAFKHCVRGDKAEAGKVRTGYGCGT